MIMNEKLKTRVLETLRHRNRGETYNPLVKEGYTESEIINAVYRLKEDGLIVDNPSSQWWKEDRLSGPGSHVLNEIEEERDSKLYWNMIMEDHRRAG